MNKERELLKRVVEYMWVGDIVEEIKELLAQPEQEPFFQNTYYADNLEDIMEDFYDKLNAYDCVIPLDENGFNEGVFEVIINWREE